MESVKQFLFADEFGVIDEDHKVNEEDLRLVFNHFIEPMLHNLERIINQYREHWTEECCKMAESLPAVEFMGKEAPLKTNPDEHPEIET